MIFCHLLIFFQNQLYRKILSKNPRQTVQTHIRPEGYKTFSMLNSAQRKIYPAHKC